MDSSAPMNILAERLLRGAHANTLHFSVCVFVKYLIKQAKHFCFFVEQVIMKELNLASNMFISDSSSLSLLR